MKNYEFKIRLCDGFPCGGSLVYEANNYEQAEDMLVDEVGKKLYEAFPSLDIEYSWEFIGDDSKKHIEKIKKGDAFYVNGHKYIAKDDAHYNADEDCLVVYDENDNGWFEEDVEVN